jgi:CheY-like chemotaxis protein
MAVRFAFKAFVLTVLLGGLECPILADPELPTGRVAQQYAPTVPVTELLENERAAVQQSLTNNAATESQRQADLKASRITPARAVMLTLGALLLWWLLAPRLARMLLRRSDPWAETGLSAKERVADQRAFTDFAAAFKVGPSAVPLTVPGAPTASRPAGDAWELSADVASADEAGALQVSASRVRQSAPVPAPAPALVAQAVEEHQKAARRVSLAADASNELSRLSLLLSGIAAREDTEGRRELLTETCTLLGAFKDRANLSDALPAWQMAAALEGLMKQLAGRPGRATASSLHTAEAGLELLKDLCVPGVRPGLANNPPPRFLVVDDDTICRYAVAAALKKIFTEPELALDGAAALALAEHEKFDVIFLDIEMPGMDGFELCPKIRTTANNQQTPVVFVTSHSDFDSRLKSTLTGAQELIAKPFLSFEIALKALTLLLHGRLNAERLQPAVQPAAALPAAPHLEPRLEPAAAVATVA